MIKDTKRDMIAIFLVALIICGFFFVIWTNNTANDTSHLKRLSDATDQLYAYIHHYDSLAPLEMLTFKPDPNIFKDAAIYAPDYGTANELHYIAELITRYNAGADVEVLHEAYELLNELLPHMRNSF